MINSWDIPRIWEGGTCYIIGGGPSAAELFEVPEGLSHSVWNKNQPLSALSPYMEPIHSEHVIAVNSAFLLGDWVDVVFFGDKGWYVKNRIELARFFKLKVTVANYFANRAVKGRSYEGIHFVARDNARQKGLSQNPKTLSWNKNSGACAIDLAVHFGAKKIYLLGFDMSTNGRGKSHWHGEYNQAKPPPFSIHLKGFPFIAKHARQMDIKIINLNPNSEIKSFPVEIPPWKR